MEGVELRYAASPPSRAQRRSCTRFAHSSVTIRLLSVPQALGANKEGGGEASSPSIPAPLGTDCEVLRGAM